MDYIPLLQPDAAEALEEVSLIYSARSGKGFCGSVLQSRHGGHSRHQPLSWIWESEKQHPPYQQTEVDR